MAYYAPREADFARLSMDLKRDSLFEPFLYGYYSKCSSSITLDNTQIDMHILIKAVEICSWSYHRANDYYQLAFSMFETI